MAAGQLNPFSFSGPLAPPQMVDREPEAEELVALAEAGHSSRLVAPRRYGKTTLLQRVLEDAEQQCGMSTALVDLEGVLSLGSIVVRIERAYNRRLRGAMRKSAERLLRAWNLGLSLGAGGFAVTLQSNPHVDAESVLLRLLNLPADLAERTGRRTLIVFDEIQDVLRVEGADGLIRSCIQHHGDAASYAFAGSAPGLMSELFEKPSRPLLEQAVPMALEPLPRDELCGYVEDRFAHTGRDPGDALTPLIDFVRGHPQRSMLLAHQLWRLTPPNGVADEGAWLKARDAALRLASPALEAMWQALSVNEQRVAVALATSPRTLHHVETRELVGLKKGSVWAAVERLEARGDVMGASSTPRLTDPLLELWLGERGAL
jgi:hypothetical protein